VTALPVHSAPPAPVDAALVARVRGRLAADTAAPTAARVAALVREEAGVRGAAQVLAAVETLRSELLGAGPLEELLHEPGVTDVLVNGPREVWVDRGRGLERADAHFSDDREIRRLAVRLAAAAGRRLDDAVPCADIRLADGVRLHAVLPPVSPGGAYLSFRVPRQRAFSLDELVDLGAMPSAAAQLLLGVVASRASFVVTGGTGTGKTTARDAAMSAAGMSTAEYAIGTVAACAFAALLYKVVTSTQILDLLTGVVSRALHVPF
jgi:pilus assembly protein CpaF